MDHTHNNDTHIPCVVWKKKANCQSNNSGKEKKIFFKKKSKSNIQYKIIGKEKSHFLVSFDLFI